MNDIDPKVKAALEKLYDAPNHSVPYHGSGLGDRLTAHLTQADLATCDYAPGARPGLQVRVMVTLTPTGCIVVENLRKAV